MRYIRLLPAFFKSRRYVSERIDVLSKLRVKPEQIVGVREGTYSARPAITVRSGHQVSLIHASFVPRCVLFDSRQKMITTYMEAECPIMAMKARVERCF